MVSKDTWYPPNFNHLCKIGFYTIGGGMAFKDKLA